MYGAGTFALTDVKQIVVTNSFLGLDRDVKNCQNEEAFEHCSSQTFLQEVSSRCHCIPYSLKDFSNSQVYF